MTGGGGGEMWDGGGGGDGLGIDWEGRLEGGGGQEGVLRDDGLGIGAKWG